jgi:hypothetical protein
VGVGETCADNYPNPPLTPPFISGENLLSIHVLHGTSIPQFSFLVIKAQLLPSKLTPLLVFSLSQF